MRQCLAAVPATTVDDDDDDDSFSFIPVGAHKFEIFHKIR
jgi:hypothetical protein